jgi:hypothetical protein
VSPTPQSLTTLEAREKAQWIVFAPFVFHAAFSATVGSSLPLRWKVN